MELDERALAAFEARALSPAQTKQGRRAALLLPDWLDLATRCQVGLVI